MVSRAARVWVPTLLLLGVLVALVRLASRPLSNPDTYFHLRFGQEFLDGWSLRDPGSVSSFATRDWLPTQWLPQVLMAWAEERGGLAAVAWISGLQFVLLALVLTWVCRQHADLVVTAVVVPVTVAACFPALSMRPQVLSYAFMAVAVHLWWRASTTGARAWWLVPLTWFWAMWHGMWPFVLVVGAVGVVACVAHRRPDLAEMRRHVSVLAGCALAAAVTPVGPGLYAAVLTVAGRGRFFSEWGEPDFTSAQGAAVVLLGASGLLVFLRRGTDWPTALMLGLGLGLALYSTRTLPLAAVTLMPVAAAAFQSLIGSAPTPIGRRAAGVGLASALLGLAILALVVPRTADEAPVRAEWVDDELDALPPGTVVLNDWGDGGYVMWAHPQLDLVMHGYGDTFTTDELERNSDILELQRGWQQLVRETGAQVAFLRTDHPLTAALEDEDWTVVETSDDVELLRAPDDWLD